MTPREGVTPHVLTRHRFATALVVLLALFLAAAVFGVTSGPSGLDLSQVRAAFAGDADAMTRDIVMRIRLPRVGLAAVVGASLAVAGLLFQALLRNPLADPFILGISGGAALGGILVLAFGSAVGVAQSAVPFAAFAGAILATVLLFGITGFGGRVSTTGLLLTGVVFNAFASAAIVFIASLAGLTEGASIFLWLIGNLSDGDPHLVALVAPFLAAGVACAFPLARGLNLLALGEEQASQLGVEVERHKRILLLATSLMVGAAVAVSGLVGFVGLIIPHLLRLVYGPDHRLLVPASALAGAAFLVACDTAARTVMPGRELPVGAITALVGGPLFLVLLRRHHRSVYANG